MVPHLEHMEPIVVTGATVVADVGMWVLGKKTDHQLASTNMGMHSARRKLTFAGMQAFDPRVLNVCVAATSTHLKPSATGSATTESTRFLKSPALGARHWRCKHWCGNC